MSVILHIMDDHINVLPNSLRVVFCEKNVCHVVEYFYFAANHYMAFCSYTFIFECSFLLLLVIMINPRQQPPYNKCLINYKPLFYIFWFLTFYLFCPRLAPKYVLCWTLEFCSHYCGYKLPQLQPIMNITFKISFQTILTKYLTEEIHLVILR